MSERIRRRSPRALRRLVYRGASRHCPLCDSSVRAFLLYGLVARADALCPVCDSLERHRLAWLFLERHTNLLDGRRKRLLHFAPEPVLEKSLRGVPALDYVSADLEPGRAMQQIDITRTGLPDGSFDVVYCSHVLEHVADDGRAMDEVRRLLSPRGWAVFQVPIDAEKTFEDPSVTDPAERERLFGQSDHVRVYGPDFRDRLLDAGFHVNRATADDLTDRASAIRLGLKDEEVYFCTSKRLRAR